MQFQHRTSFAALLLAILAAVCSSIPAQAHFNHFQPRVIHILEKADGVSIYVRVPWPLEILPLDWRGIDAGGEVLFESRL